METLLSLTSKRAGDWFKEELRLLGGLDHIVDKVKECADNLNQEDEEEKMVTVHNPENQSYLIAYKDSSLIVSSAKVGQHKDRRAGGSDSDGSELCPQSPSVSATGAEVRHPSAGSGPADQPGGVQCQEQVLSDGDGDGGSQGPCDSTVLLNPQHQDMSSSGPLSAIAALVQVQ
ncbi:hypothetical protein INR49_003272 [Caranx melampygus]|nr:hypothetical protein INR49_003272 [Caranx melampygus]